MRVLSSALLLLLAALGGGLAHAQQDELEETEPVAADAGAHSESAQDDPVPDSGLSAKLAVGAGVTQRSLEVPSLEGTRTLDPGLTPALHLGLSGRYRSEQRFIGLYVSYQSSVRARTRDAIGDTSVVPSEVAIRSHRFEAGVMPGLFLSTADNAASLALFAGYAVRAFGSVEVLRIPRFSLHGPLARVELQLPLTGWLGLRLAPEAQLVLSLSRGLRELAGLPHGALGLGGEVALQLRLSDTFSAELLYREAHVLATGLEDKRFEDTERYLLLVLCYRAL